MSLKEEIEEPESLIDISDDEIMQAAVDRFCPCLFSWCCLFCSSICDLQQEVEHAVEQLAGDNAVQAGIIAIHNSIGSVSSTAFSLEIHIKMYIHIYIYI